MQSEEMKRVTSGLTQPVDWLEISEKENQRDTGFYNGTSITSTITMN